MPIFISYSHANRDFVDKLAGQLVREKVHVWLDRWELSLGDSLIDKVQNAVQGAGALLVVLSKASVESEWCKKELTAGLFRELDEKRVVVMPVLLEDCAVPMFLRDKFYADFRTDFDAGLRTVLEGVAKISNASLAREVSADNHTDWSIASGYRQGQIGVFLTFVQQEKDQPYTVVTEIGIFPGPDANAHLETVLKESGKVKMRFAAVGALMSCLNAEADVSFMTFS
ncbi:toll/interleukin-1 receptor domain-containing protein [Paraburkholderia sediminicola]|uniref:toll/interleukin-1 receptor domain-containing protein n=1 Tax=Paraburkholderia sediminicola TaxID=458836 RepID=UPI0038B86E60